MIYMFKLYLLIAVIVFSLAGFAILISLVIAQAQDYARARLAMRRIARDVPRESFAISRNVERAQW